MFVTRQQYDSLVTRFPAWMAAVWPMFDRRWSFGGCRVDAHPGTPDGALAALADRLVG